MFHHLDQATEPRAHTPYATDSWLARVDPAPCGPSCVLIEPTWPRSSRRGPDRADGPRTATTSRDSVIFCGSLSHFDKASTIFEFPVNHFATLLLQCSIIFISVLSHFRELNHFLVATVNSAF
jgi:hypothetical protein